MKQGNSEYISEVEKQQHENAWFSVSNKGKVSLDKFEIIEKLRGFGFLAIHFLGKYVFLKVEDNVIHRVDAVMVKHFFKNYIEGLDNYAFVGKGTTKRRVLSSFQNVHNSHINDNELAFLTDFKPLNLQQHTEKTAFFYYQNGFVSVTKKGVELKKYAKLDGKIWKDRILHRNYKRVGYKDQAFFKFMQNISGYRTGADKKGKCIYNEAFQDRFDSLVSIIGYSMHSFFENKRKAILFTDAKISAFGEPNGRTGKSLLMRMISKMLDAGAKSNMTDEKKTSIFVELNGKDWDSGSKFKFQECRPETMLVCINDIQRNFNFEDMFNVVTDGLKVENKGEDPFTIQVKLIITSNTTIKLDGGSSRDRAVEYELQEYYSENHSPLSEFGEWFFRDWNTSTWAAFDSFMLDCVMYYFKHGIVSATPINLSRRKLLEETDNDFVELMDELLAETNKGSTSPEFEPLYQKNLYEKLVKEVPSVSVMKKGAEGYYRIPIKWFSVQKMTKWLIAYAKYSPYISEMTKTKSNGDVKITFSKTPQKHKEDEKKNSTPWNEKTK